MFAGEKSNGSKRWPLLDDPERLERFFLSECPRHLEAELRNRNGGLKNLLNDSSGRSELLELIPKILMRLISDLDEQQESKAETATTMEKAADQAQGDNVDAYPNGEVLLSGTYQSDTSLSKRKEESGGFPSSLNETRPGNSTIAAPLPPTPTNIFESLDWLHQMQESNEDPNDISFEDILNPPGQNSFDDILNTSDQPTFEDFLEASGPNCFGEASDSAEHIESSDFEKHTGAIPSLTRSGSELAPSPPSDMDAYGRFDLGKVEVVEPSSSVQKPIHKGASQVACPYGEDVSAKGKSRNVVSDSFSATVCGADADESLSMGSLD